MDKLTPQEKNAGNWLVARLKEPSTYAGIAAIGALVAGHALDPGTMKVITTAGSGLAGLLAVIVSEN